MKGEWQGINLDFELVYILITYKNYSYYQSNGCKLAVPANYWNCGMYIYSCTILKYQKEYDNNGKVSNSHEELIPLIIWILYVHFLFVNLCIYIYI